MASTRLVIGISGINIEVDGEEQFVKEVFDFFKEKLAERVSAAPLAQAAHAPETAETPAAEGTPSLRDFYQQKQPRNDMERVAVFAYYKLQFEGVPQVTEGDIAPMYDEVRARRPVQTRNALNNARTHHGLFERGTPAGTFRISPAGKNLVEHDLPHQPRRR